MRALGIDPGLASMGVAVVDWDPASDPDALPTVAVAYVATTKKSPRGKITTDDVRRMQQLWLNIEQTILEFKPDVIGVETYTVYRAAQGGHRGNGVGWKALYAYAMTCAVGFTHDIPVLPFMPADLKRRMGHDRSASKLDIEQAVGAATSNLYDFLEGIPNGQHEHAADAVGHALLALADHARATGMIPAGN